MNSDVFSEILKNNPQLKIISDTSDNSKKVVISKTENTPPKPKNIGKVKSLGSKVSKDTSKPLIPILEDDFQKTVIGYAQMKGWKVAAFRKALTKDGNWITPVQGDGKGWPDLFFASPKLNRFFWAELKSEKGILSPEQIAWIALLRFCGAEVYVWKPKDWDQIEKVLETK